MNPVSKVTATAKSTVVSQTKGYFSWENWPYLLTALLVLSLVVLATSYFKRKLKGTKVSEPKKKKIKAPPVSRLARVWKHFLREIPWDLRRAIMLYQHFIVLGELNAGKSSLIDNHTDWQGHARRFYPSYTSSSLLRIYLGSRILIQEVPSALLNDSSTNARKALEKLWRPLYRRKDPTVVVVVNSVALQSSEISVLNKQAQSIRGKINLLSRIRRKAINVRVALTHMDQIDGFLEFSQFLTINKIPLELKFDSSDELQGLSGCLESYENYLTHALTSLPADKYLKAISFLRIVPNLFDELAAFLKILQQPDHLSLTPKVVNVCLTFEAGERAPVSNPFATALKAKDLQKFNPLIRHRIAAGTFAVFGFIYLLGAYLYEYRIIDARYDEMEFVEANPPARYNDDMHRLFIDPFTSIEQKKLMVFLPDFFPHINQEINARCIENIRKFYLIPELEKFYLEDSGQPRKESDPLKEIRNLRQSYIDQIEDAQNKVLYLLGLIYATSNNELGKMIRKNVPQWSAGLGFPETLIHDYVTNNRSSRNLSLNIDNIYYRQKVSLAEEPHTWMVYFLKFSKACRKSFITRNEFKELQEEANVFLDIIQAHERYDLSYQISQLLKEDNQIDFDIDITSVEDSQIRQDTIKDFFLSIAESSIDYPEVTSDLNLTDLHDNLKVMLHFKEMKEHDSLFHFLFSGQEFKFSGKLWNNLLNRSRITLFLRDFVSFNKRQNGMLFFNGEDKFSDLVMNPSNDGRFFFTGHARVDGKYTREALERRVEPILRELPVFIQKLPIEKKEKSYFSNFLSREVQAYADRYADAYKNYYMDYNIEVDSLGALRYVLNQLTFPSSNFMDVLFTVRDNTTIDPKENPYLMSLSLRLREFEFFNRLMNEEKGAFPELDKYKALLEQMLMDIQQPESVDNQDETKPFHKAISRLTPLGRISFAIIRNDPDSYFNLVKLWLESVGITSHWQDVFLAPVYQAYLLGLQEIEADISRIYEELWYTNIRPLYGRFPFAPNSEKEILFEELKQATHPAGVFWKTFHSLLRPYCVIKDDLWKKRQTPLMELTLPDGMLDILNAMDRLSSFLWNDEGEARPLTFYMKPIPLSSSRDSQVIPVLSYLHAGEESIFGFNQKPAWKKFDFRWHVASRASVGVEFTSEDGAENAQGSVSVSKRPWSFFRLLQRTEDFVEIDDFSPYREHIESVIREAPVGGDVTTSKPILLSWRVTYFPGDGTVREDGNFFKVRFAVDNSPWALFELPKQ